MRRFPTAAAFATLAFSLALAACSRGGGDPNDQIGPNPKLPEPQQYLLPPMHVAAVRKWTGNETPTVAPGLKVQAFATGLAHPRSLYVLPNGDVLVVMGWTPPDGIDVPKWRC